jgi:hypothetical protein
MKLDANATHAPPFLSMELGVVYNGVQGSFSQNSLNPTKSWGQKHK